MDPRLLRNPQLLFSPVSLAAAARCMYTRIDSFTGEFRFLSLDFPSIIFFQGRFFPSARHALLASRYPKSVDELSTIEDIKTLKKVSKEKEVREVSGTVFVTAAVGVAGACPWICTGMSFLYTGDFRKRE